MIHTLIKLLLPDSKGKYAQVFILSPVDHYWVQILFTFALSNLVCFEILDFAFKCDSKSSWWNIKKVLTIINHICLSIYLMTATAVSTRLSEQEMLLFLSHSTFQACIDEVAGKLASIQAHCSGRVQTALFKPTDQEWSP